MQRQEDIAPARNQRRRPLRAVRREGSSHRVVYPGPLPTKGTFLHFPVESPPAPRRPRAKSSPSKVVLSKRKRPVAELQQRTERAQELLHEDSEGTWLQGIEMVEQIIQGFESVRKEFRDKFIKDKVQAVIYNVLHFFGEEERGSPQLRMAALRVLRRLILSKALRTTEFQFDVTLEQQGCRVDGSVQRLLSDNGEHRLQALGLLLAHGARSPVSTSEVLGNFLQDARSP